MSSRLSKSCRMPKQLTPETLLKNAVKQYLGFKGYFHFHVMQGLGAYKGISDVIAIKDGRVLFIELKRPKGVQNEHQIAFQQNVEAKGGKYLLVKTIDDLIRGLEG